MRPRHFYHNVRQRESCSFIVDFMVSFNVDFFNDSENQDETVVTLTVTQPNTGDDHIIFEKRSYFDSFVTWIKQLYP